ncbi:hypothetical protein D9611_004380 [Ephemerocybe angulata]|uniref:Non-specific serine/threonine protein kinase n=1 Tax=Ephemerocybe angulata TaxID=980116 RepID=A0A8H5BK89_9AGAR|nr:hypothetical protein D9611_004380 [Tulosesus angulatus]
MSLKDLLALAPVPGLDAAVTLLTSSYQNIKQISVYRKQCEDMADRVVGLMLSVRDGSEGIEGTRAVALADELDPVLKHINRKVREWADWGPLKCFLQQGDLRDGIDMLQRQLDGAILRFGVAMNLEVHRSLVHSERVQQSTREEFRGSLQAIMDNQREISKLLAISSPQPVEQVMMHLQTELRDPDIPQEQNESFRKGLWELRSKTAKLPPLTDLTGQVELESRHPEFKGTYNDVYLGTWLDKEKVAVRFPRTLSDSAVVHKKFQQEVSMWRTFDHPNVLPLYGIVYIGKHLYSVSPWMSHGTAIGYVQKYPEANQLKLLSEISEGLAYLHAKDIVHGDLRGANVLISEDGVARLSDFGLSKFLEDCNKGLTSASSINPRWFAPEILKEKPLSKESDIWSLGMTFLELLTGQQPFSHIIHDFNVMNEISKYRTPNRPTSEPAVSAGLNDALWGLLKRCWEKPKDRPTIQEVLLTLAEIRGEASSSRSMRSAKTKLSTIFTIKNSRKNSSGSRPTTANSEDSSNSSTSTKMANSLRGLSIHSIQEGQEYYSFSPKTPSPLLGSSPGSHSTFSASYSPVQPNRRPSYGSEQQPAHHLFLETRSPISPTSPHDYLNRELSSAPKLELTHLNSPPSAFDRTIRSPVRAFTNGTTHNATPRSILTVDSINEDPLLHQAITDPDRSVYTNASGAVVAGTLEGLVDRLVNNFNLRKDEEYREVILTACIDFITPEELFSMLQWRFDEAEQDTRRHPGDRVATQYNVFMVMLYWLSRRQLPVDSQLLWQMRGFCETATRMKSSSTMVDRAADLIQLIDKRPQQDAIPRTPLSPGRRIMTADEITPQGLAIALTLLEGDKFKAIMPCDYLANQCRKPGFNNVDAACSVNSKIITWIKQSLLHYDALQARASVLKFFINTAQECRKLRNYQSLIAIAIALDSAPVQSLALTRNFLSSKMVSQLEELVRLPDPEGNHYRYRQVLEEVIDPTYSESCIPWIAVHLKDLHSVLHLNKRVVVYHGQALLNFERYAKFMDKLRAVFPYPPPDLERFRQQGQLAYLEDKLANVRVDEEADDQLFSRSQSVRATEKVLSDLKVPERVRLGFRVPQSMKASITG